MLVSICQCQLGSLANVRTAKAQAVSDAIVKSGGQAIAVPGDMLDADYIKVLVKKTAEFGNGKIHIIVNNAGSASSPQTSCPPANFVADILGTALFTR